MQLQLHWQLVSSCSRTASNKKGNDTGWFVLLLCFHVSVTNCNTNNILVP
jgi:hypothetical protein